MQINARHAHSAKLPRGLTRCQLEPEASAMIQAKAAISGETFNGFVKDGAFIVKTPVRPNRGD